MSTQELEKMRLDEHMQIPACLQQMLMQEWCTDVTLCCQGRRFRAHRVLLSACSTYLQEILWIHRKKTHATVILQDVQPEDMESLLCFLYSGEVTLPEERLESFISLAHQLKISVFIDKHLYEKSITLDRRRSSTETRDRRTATAPETNESPVTMETTGRSWDREKQSAMDQEKFSLNCDTKLITNDDEGGQSDVLKKSYLIAAQKLNSMSDYNSQFERYDQFLSRIDRSNPPVIFKDTTSPCQMSIKPESTDHNHNHHHHHQAHQAAAAFHCNVNYQHILSSISAGCLEQQSNDTDKLLVNPSGHNRLSQHEEHLLNYFHDQLNYGYNFVAGGSFRTSSLSKDKFTGPGDWPWIGAVAQGSWTRPKPQLLPVPIISPVVTGEKERCDGVPRSLKSSPGGILTPSPWAQNKVPWVGEIRRPTPKRPVVIPPRPPHDLPEPTPALPCEDIAVSLPCIIKPHIFSENLALSQNHKISPRRDLPIPATLVKINDKPTHHGDSGGGGRLRQETYLRLAPGSYENSQHPVVGDKTTQESVDFFRSNDRSPKPPFVAAEMSSAVSKSITHDQGCLFEVTSLSKDGCSSTENKSSTIEVTPDSGDSFNDTNNNCRFPFFTADDNRQKCKDVVAVTKGALAASGALTKLVCHTCKQQFASHVALEQHVASTHALDDDEKNLACAICKKSFEDKESWCADQKSHADASSSESAKKSMDHECTDCGKKFVTRASLKVHMRTHTGEKPFHCTECGKQFSQLRNYKYHRSVHEGTKEFAATCPECGKYFNDRGYLSSHMKIHRNRKEYGCEFCGKSFNQRVAYNMHVRIHTGEKPHVCPHCGKCFSRKMLLKQHLRIHTGEKPFQCVICQKAFADRSNMTLHMRLHSGVKPYTCTVCSKSFTKKHHLKTHMNYHTGVKPYSCQKCGLKFSQSSNMRTHYKKCVALPPKMVAPVNPMNSSSS